MKKRLLSLLLALVMIAGMIPAAALAVSAADGDEVAAMVDEMSLEDKITQMLMVDFRKWGVANGSATDFTVMNDEVRQILADYRFGAVILFANNVKDTEQSFNLAQDFRALSRFADRAAGAFALCADNPCKSVRNMLFLNCTQFKEVNI